MTLILPAEPAPPGSRPPTARVHRPRRPIPASDRAASQLGTERSVEILTRDVTAVAYGTLTLPAMIDTLTRSPAYGTRFGVT